jgi:methionyl-tRNA formyltransferase
VRLVFLGSPPFATPILARLVESPHRPLAVVTQPARAQGRGRKLVESAVASLARTSGIELLEPETVREPAVHARLAALEPDVFLVVSYGEILRPEFLALARTVALNVHPSLLPRHRGATPIQAALLACDEVAGVSIQQVAKELDAGDLLLRRETAIRPLETAGELAARLAEWSSELVLEALTAVEAGSARYVPQDAARATYCKKLERAHGRIDWSRPARELEGRVRAVNPWPGAFARLPSGAEFFLWRAAARSEATSAPPGTILEAGKRLCVATGEGVLELLELQNPGKRAMSAAEYLRGARLAVGKLLGTA